MNSNSFNHTFDPTLEDFEPPIFRHRSTPHATPPAPQPAPQNSTLAGLKFSDAIAFNVEAEFRFVALIIELLDAGEVLTPATIYQEAAFELNISVATAKRYLIKHTARRALFGIDAGGRVFAK